MNPISAQNLNVHGPRLPNIGSIILFKRSYGSYLLFIIILNKIKKVLN